MEIIGYPKYLIYRDGRVQNKKSKVFLKPRDDRRGYDQVYLSREGERKNNKIHRLIALHYIPNPEGKPQVDHIDRNRGNNNISNLRWATPSENNENQNRRTDNTSGHRNISYYKRNDLWMYKKEMSGQMVQRRFITKTEALCFKYIHILKIRAA